MNTILVVTTHWLWKELYAKFAERSADRYVFVPVHAPASAAEGLKPDKIILHADVHELQPNIVEILTRFGTDAITVRERYL